MEIFITVDVFCCVCGHDFIDAFLSTSIFADFLLYVCHHNFLIFINLKMNQHTINRTINDTCCRNLCCYGNILKKCCLHWLCSQNSLMLPPVRQVAVYICACPDSRHMKTEENTTTSYKCHLFRRLGEQNNNIKNRVVAKKQILKHEYLHYQHHMNSISLVV